MYDQRSKAQRDYEWAITSACEEGIEKGREKGREEGEQFGILKGKIQLLEQLLGTESTTEDEFKQCVIETLAAKLTVLQQRLRYRQA